jgi:dTDP-4-dehydrorhamnose 3,5-epimerase
MWTQRLNAMKVTPLTIPEVLIVEPVKHGDDRGFFSETYNQQTWHDAGVDLVYIQDNHSLSAAIGTIRGLHFQSPPFAQDKLVRVTRGAIWDVAVDIRLGSPTYGQWVGEEISAENWRQILVPKGFAHGFCTLEPDTEVQYKVTAPYSGNHDKGLKWDDPALAIDWPLSGEAQLSAKDQHQPLLSKLPAYFHY